jgi:hypothetical protein
MMGKSSCCISIKLSKNYQLSFQAANKAFVSSILFDKSSLIPKLGKGINDNTKYNI